MPRLKVDLIVDDKGTLVVKNFARKTSGYMHSAAGSVRGVAKALTSVQSLLAGAGLAMGAKSFLDVASSFEQMEKQLNVLTHGHGVETLERINAWALDMPVNTQEAVKAFKTMAAMGLDPNIKKLQTLVDVASIFGDDSLPRLSLVLGQMKTLGRVQAQDLNQLVAVGINARKYLREAFSMSVPEIQKAGIDINKVIKAIMDGLDRDFGGAAKANMNSWKGLTASFESYAVELERRVMNAGVFNALKIELGSINTELKDWTENNSELIKQEVPEYVESIKDKTKSLYDFYKSLPEGTGYGIIGAALFGPRVGLLIGVLANIDSHIDKMQKKLGIGASKKSPTAAELQAKTEAIIAGNNLGLIPEATFVPQRSTTSHAGAGKISHTAAGSSTATAGNQPQKFYDLYYSAAGPEGPPTDLLLANIKSYQDDMLKNHKDTNAAALDDTQDTVDKMSQDWRSAESNIQSFSSNTFYNLMAGNFGNIGKSFADMLLHMVANYESATMTMALMGNPQKGTSGLLGLAIDAGASWLTGQFGDMQGPQNKLPSTWHAPMALPEKSYAVGTDYVPHDMLAYIHRGEAIIPASRNPGKTSRQSNKSITNITVNVSSGTPDNVRRSAGQGARQALALLAAAKRYA